MQATIDVKKFKQILDLASKFVASHSTLPVLENIFIKSDGSQLIFRATDMEKHLEIKTDAQVSGQGAITASVKMLRNFVKTLEQDSIDLEIDQNDDMLKVSSDRDDFEIQGIPASEYVAIPSLEEENRLQIDAQKFVKGISKVQYAVTERNFTPALTGVLVKLKKTDDWNKIVFAGTDTFRLAEYQMDFDGEYRDMEVIIPKKNILDVKRLAKYFIKNDGQYIDVNFAKNLISFSCELDDMQIFSTSLLVEGDFPNYEDQGIIPDTTNSSVVAQASDLDSAIEKISILTKDINNFVDIDIQDDQLVISSWETDQGEAESVIDAQIDWDKYNLGLNGKYVQDFLDNIENMQVEIKVQDENSSMLFCDKWDDDYTYVVKPFVK